MDAYSLFQKIDVTLLDWSPQIYSSHRHNFYELFYVLDGVGIHSINDINYNYQKGDLFLLMPGDIHHLEVIDRTKYCVIVFNKLYFKQATKYNLESIDFSEIFSNLEVLFKNNIPFQQPVLTATDCNKQIERIVQVIIQEYENKASYYEIVLQSSVLQLLCLIGRKARAASSLKANKNKKDADIAEIIFYIQDNIYNTENLKVSALSKYFNKSANQFSMYFKEMTGDSPKSFIQRYKLELIKNKLENSHIGVSEIAYQLGFTDESHLNKFLKKYIGTTATEYRKRRYENLRQQK